MTTGVESPQLIAVLTVRSFNGAVIQPISASFDEIGGTVGRAEINQLVLPDPERSISRIHASIVYREGTYAVIDHGSNPVLVNGIVVGHGREARIGDGDQLMVGGYGIAVAHVSKPITQNPFAQVTFAPTDAVPIEPARLVTTTAVVSSPPLPPLPAAATAATETALKGAVLSWVEPSRDRLRFSSAADAGVPMGRRPPKPAAPRPVVVEPVSTPVAPAVTKDSTPSTDTRTSQSRDKTISHLRSALRRALARANPAAIESQLRQSERWFDALPIARKARLWDMFVALSPQLTSKALDEFDRLVATTPAADTIDLHE